MGAQRIILAIALILAPTGLSVNREEMGAVPEYSENGQQVLSCSPPHCPEPRVSYRPDYPELGQYSLTQMCAAVHTASSLRITLRNTETLESAVRRLHELSGSDKINGVIEIPWNVDTVQCDSLRIMKSDTQLSSLTIKGVPGPAGEQPRFYCRSAQAKYDLGGTIPRHSVTPYFFRMALDTQWHQVMFENLHIDGYGGALKLGNSGHYVVRNSYMHHGPDNGVASANLEYVQDRGGDTDIGFSLQVCGSEISHYGQDNSKHNFYVHRALGGGGENPLWMALGAANSWSEVAVVDSVIHSPGWGSAFKSIANRNVIVGNKFFSELTTDTSYPVSERFSAQMLIDVPSCSTNIIRNNSLHGVKNTRRAGGATMLGLRNRRTAMRGCDIPMAWHWESFGDASVPTKIDGPAHDDDWWRNLNGGVLFSTSIEDNVFEVEGIYSHLQTAIEFAGTYPVYEGFMKQSCLLPTPESWYERSRVYLKDNVYAGFSDSSKIFRVAARKHSILCQDQSQPTGPGPVKKLESVIGMGLGEIYHYQQSGSLPERLNHDSN